MGFYVCVCCLFVLGIRDDFIWLTVAKTSNTFNLGWASMPWEMLDTRLSFVSGQEAEGESGHLYYLVRALFLPRQGVCLTHSPS